MILKILSNNEWQLARPLHRNSTSPAYARTVPIACDAFNARTMAEQKYHCADIGLSPFKLRLDLDDKCFPLGCIYVIFDDIPKV